MKNCAYCGKELPDDNVRCPIDGELFSEATPIPVGSSPSTSSQSLPTASDLSLSSVTERNFLIIELVLVCVIAFGTSLILSLNSMSDGSSLSRPTSMISWGYMILQQLGCLGLIWFLLAKRSESFAKLGLIWSWPMLGWSILLYIGGTALFHVGYRIFYTVAATVNLFSATPENVGHHFVSGGISIFTIAALLINPFFEELIVRAYLITTVKCLTRSSLAAVLISTALQTSYHLYQGIPLALGEGMIFLLFSIYYSYSGRITPVILAHFYMDVVAIFAYWVRNKYPGAF